MILLDTNVISALMLRKPDARVIGWLDDQPAESIWTTSITVFELRAGLELLKPTKRRKQLEDAFASVLDRELDGRVQVFDQAAARAAANVAAERQRAGQPVEIRDAQIAGIARARRASLATRNTRRFDGLGIALLDPWSS